MFRRFRRSLSLQSPWSRFRSIVSCRSTFYPKTLHVFCNMVFATCFLQHVFWKRHKYKKDTFWFFSKFVWHFNFSKCHFTPIITGIVSYGINTVRKIRDSNGKVVEINLKCGKKNVPGVYTRVSHYIPWIYENMIPET